MQSQPQPQKYSHQSSHPVLGQGQARPAGKNKNSYFARHPKFKKRALWILATALGLLVLVVIIGGILYAIYGKDVKNAYSQAVAGKTNLEEAQELIKKQDLGNAREKVISARTNFQSAETSLEKVSWMNAIPLVHRQLFSVDQLLVASIQLTGSLEKLVGSTERITAPLKSDKISDFHSLSAEQKKEMLAAFHEESPVFEEVKAELEVAHQTIDLIPDFGTIRQIRDVKKAATEKLPELERAIDDVLVFSKILPDIAGYKEERPYLLLFQNNTELRPSGGFIGTYGILVLENGEIKNFVSDDVYNLDKDGRGDKNPPEPIKKYINKEWFFRDANWSPDFPTSAKKAEEFYHAEGGKGEFAGVIAVTPTLLQSFLEVTGPVKVKGYTFTKDNTVDQLEFIVERGFTSLGLPEEDRKDIIGEFSNTVINELFKLPKEKWLEFADLVIDHFHQKHAALFVDDENIQKIVSEQDWDGKMKETDGDYVQMVDANLASLKSDPAVKRTLNYELDATNLDDVRVKMTMNYNHIGTFDWKTTRYNTYSRLYVPEGSEITGVNGQRSDSPERRYADATRLDVTTELGKTAFGGYKSIEPGKKEDLVIEYKLPARIAQQIREGTYRLLVQKQSGTVDHELNVRLKFNKDVATFSPAEGAKIVNDKEVQIDSNLKYDRTFTITF